VDGKKREYANRHFATVAKHAVADGLDAVAVLDSEGRLLALAGDLDANETRAVAAFANRDSDDRSRLMNGDVLDASIDDQPARVAIAASVWIVMVFPRDPSELQRVVDRLRMQCDQIVAMANEESARDDILPPPSSSGGGSSSGPAELPLVEVGITVRRGQN